MMKLESSHLAEVMLLKAQLLEKDEVIKNQKRHSFVLQELHEKEISVQEAIERRRSSFGGEILKEQIDMVVVETTDSD